MVIALRGPTDGLGPIDRRENKVSHFRLQRQQVDGCKKIFLLGAFVGSNAKESFRPRALEHDNLILSDRLHASRRNFF